MWIFQRNADHHRCELCVVDQVKLWLSWFLSILTYACFRYDAAVAVVPIDWRSYWIELGLFAIVAYGGKCVLAWLLRYSRLA